MNKRHFLQHHGDVAVPACGLYANPYYLTSNEQQVTCKRCTAWLHQRNARLEAQYQALQTQESRTAAPAPVTSLRFVQCQNCNEVYPTPQPTPCPFCEADDPDWQPWDPREEDVDHPDNLCDVIVGLLMLLEDRGELQNIDGRVYEAVKDALVLLSLERETDQSYREFWIKD